MAKNILLVDDEPDFLDMMKMRLEANDFTVVTALNGKEALEKLQQLKFDAVLLDIMMPGPDGLKVLKKIRRENKNLPVFITTAFSTDERFKLAEKLDASGFIVKTSDLKREVESLNTVLGVADKFKPKKEKRRRR